MALINNILIAIFNLENPGNRTPKSRDCGIDKQAGIPGFWDPEINSIVVLGYCIFQLPAQSSDENS